MCTGDGKGKSVHWGGEKCALGRGKVCTGEGKSAQKIKEWLWRKQIGKTMVYGKTQIQGGLASNFEFCFC